METANTDSAGAEKDKTLSNPDSAVRPLEAGVTAQSQKLKTGRIPKPAPRDVDTSLTPMDEPLSSDTISLKRPSPTREGVHFKEEKRLKIFCYKCEQKLDLTEMEPFSKIECPSCRSEIIVPRWFDNYLLEEVCGEGGMAQVYRGLDLALDREIAIKILNADIAGEADRGKLFLHEARTAATLNHYALLPIYTCGQYEGQPYIVMQFMAGGSLEKELEDLEEGGKISADNAIKWMHDAAEGLDNARRHGIIHHDIKPGNLMLDSDGVLKIGDFGISQAMHDSRSEEIEKLTKMWASPDYVSPEKVSTGKETYLGDIYSLGATFYHVLAGSPPLDYDNVEELFQAKRVRDPVDIKKLRDDIPDGLASLIMSMMSRTPEARPSYRDIIAELNSLKKSRTPKKEKEKAVINVKAPMIATKLSMGAISGKKKFASSLGSLSRKKKKSMAGTIILIVVIAALAGAAWYLWKNGFFDKYTGNELTNDQVSADYLPDVTERLAAGNPTTAAMLAEKALDSAVLDLESRKQGALQLAIATYLNNDPDAKNKCILISDRLISAGVERDDATLSLLRYFAAGQIPPSNLREQMVMEDDLRLISEVAIFIKETYYKGDGSSIRTAYRNFSSNLSNFSDKYWGKKSFEGRIGLWHDWISTGKGESSSMEPLMIAYKKEASATDSSPVAATSEKPTVPSTKFIPDVITKKHDPSLSLKMLTPEWLQENRKLFAGSRPKPPDFTFDDTAIQSYLGRLPKKFVESEKMRANQITPLKAHLCGIMLHFPYGNTSIQRKSGRPVSGSFMANQKYISVKLPSGKRIRLDWSEVHFDQFVKFLDHYARLRGDAEAGTEVSKVKQKRESAWEYLRIALLCDWYGKYKEAVSYTHKAVSIDPEIENEAIVYLME